METPRELRTVDERDGDVHTREYDDGSAIAADFGVEAEDLAVDVVDETVIVVAGDRHVEFELPEGAEEITANNGIVTIEE